ncbi:MAG TPA: glutamate--tRNA ligase, partial [Candidatus Bathyarchaeota archaeon]|nr:glutamate--tRNA ligase [Candidatus Bathyarchaeota archaeon]HEX68676.1 glutamate--tRNA ligase [Candidatus Bathyarchaeota archaeon]
MNLSEDEKAKLKEDILKIALINAINYNGKAQVGPVIGKLFAEKPELKAKAKEVAALVKEVVKEVNRMPLHEQRRMVEERWPKALEKRKVEEEKGLPPLPNVEKYERVVTRFSPNPDCVLHLGSARAIVLC